MWGTAKGQTCPVLGSPCPGGTDLQPVWVPYVAFIYVTLGTFFDLPVSPFHH